MAGSSNSLKLPSHGHFDQFADSKSRYRSHRRCLNEAMAKALYPSTVQNCHFRLVLVVQAGLPSTLISMGSRPAGLALDRETAQNQRSLTQIAFPSGLILMKVEDTPCMSY